MIKKCSATLSCLVLIVCCFTAQAQFEFSAGFGANLSNLSEKVPAGATPINNNDARLTPTFTTSLGYRPNERVAVRGLLTSNGRHLQYDKVDLFDNDRPLQVISTMVSVGGEGMYFIKPWLALGVGAGYVFTDNQISFNSFPNLSVPGSNGLRTDFGSSDHTYANLALELHTDFFGLRLAPYYGLSNGQPRNVGVTDINGNKIGDLKGYWRGADLTVFVALPFGKNRYRPQFGLDSVLDKAFAKTHLRQPKLALGVSVETGAGLSLNSAAGDQLYHYAPSRLRLALDSRYRLNDNWQARGSIGYTRSRGFIPHDSLRSPNVPATDVKSNSLELALGLQRKVWKSFSLGVELSPQFLLSEWTRPNEFYTLEPQQPVQTIEPGPMAGVILNARGLVIWQVGDRVAFTGNLAYTLNNVHGKEIDTRLVPPSTRHDHKLYVGAGMSWMLLHNKPSAN